MNDWLPLWLQTFDSSFPSGAFAHSFGLEGLAQLECVADPSSFACFLEEHLVPSLERCDLPLVRLAYEAAEKSDLPRLAQLDQLCDSMKGALELRVASRRVGRQRLEMLRQLSDDPRFDALAREAECGRAWGHAVIVFGAQSALFRAPLDAALAGYYFQAVSGAASAALKLIRLGQAAAQRLIRQCLLRAADEIARSKQIQERDIGWFQPALEIASARHETAYTRIFIS